MSANASRAQLSHFVFSLSFIVRTMKRAIVCSGCRLLVVGPQKKKHKKWRFIILAIYPKPSPDSRRKIEKVSACSFFVTPHDPRAPPLLSRRKINHGHDEQAHLAFGDRRRRAGHRDGPLLRVGDSGTRVRKQKKPAAGKQKSIITSRGSRRARVFVNEHYSSSNTSWLLYIYVVLCV